MDIASAEADGTTWKRLQSNRYDGEGLRYEAEENGKVIRFAFDRGELAQEKQEDDAVSYVRDYHPISLSSSGKDRNYFVQDEMGSTLFLLDRDHEIPLHKLKETIKTFESKENSERYKSQITLAKRRVKAFEIANHLIQNEIENS